MSSSTKKIIKSIIISIFIMNIMLFSGCMNRSEESEIFHYEVNVEAESNKDFELYLPIPLISRDDNPKEGKPTKLMKELEVKSGQVDYHINKTNRGYALVINSSSSFKITGHKELPGNADNEGEYVFGNLSMSLNDESDSSYWIWYNSSLNNNVSLDFETYWRSVPEDSETYEWKVTNFIPKKGWQSVEL